MLGEVRAAAFLHHQSAGFGTTVTWLSHPHSQQIDSGDGAGVAGTSGHSSVPDRHQTFVTFTVYVDSFYVIHRTFGCLNALHDIISGRDKEMYLYVENLCIYITEAETDLYEERRLEGECLDGLACSLPTNGMIFSAGFYEAPAVVARAVECRESAVWLRCSLVGGGGGVGGPVTSGRAAAGGGGSPPSCPPVPAAAAGRPALPPP